MANNSTEKALTLRQLVFRIHQELTKAEGAYARSLEREAAQMALEDPERGPVTIGDDETGRNVWPHDLETRPARPGSFSRRPVFVPLNRPPLTTEEIAEAQAAMSQQKELARKIAAGKATLLCLKNGFEIDDRRLDLIQHIPIMKHYQFHAAPRIQATPESTRREAYRNVWASVADRIIDRLTVPGIMRDHLRVFISRDHMRSGRSSPLTAEMERLHRDGLTIEIVAEIDERYPAQAGEMELKVVGQTPDDPPPVEPFATIDRSDLLILEVLAQQNALIMQFDLESPKMTALSRNTLSKHLKRLGGLGYVHWPQGPRSGMAITLQGKKAMAKCKPPPNAAH